MGDDSQIPATGKVSAQFEYGVFNNVLYVPSLEANMLFVYQMIHAGLPKRVVFEPGIVKISNISTGKLIAKGVANHASKAYEFSHFSHIQIHSKICNQLKGKENLFYLSHLYMMMFLMMI